MDNILHLNGLSVCIIARDEEKNIKHCIESVKDAADEIIVVDTGSLDNTKKIAKDLGANVYDFEWIDDFSAARNFSFDKATKSLILFIDCDERVLNSNLLIELKKNVKPQTGGWVVNLTSESDRKSGSKDTYHSALLRIVRNAPDIRFTGAIHEQIIEPILQNGYKIEATNINIYHHGYNLSPEEMRKKQLRNLKLLEKALSENENDDHNLHHYGKTLLALGQKEKALEFLKKAIENTLKDSAVYPQSLNFASIAAYQLGRKDEAELLAKKSLEAIPDQAFANYVLGEIENDKRNWQASLEYYKKMHHNLRNPSLKARIVGDYNLPEEQIYFRFGRAYIAMKNLEKAEENFLKAIKLNPKISNNIIGLANVNFNRGNLDRARELLIDAQKMHGNQDQINRFLKEIDYVQKLNRSTTVNSKGKTNYSSVDQLKNLIKKTKSQEKSNNNFDEKPFISLAMIVKNEEKMLPVCLDSVEDLVDEMIIVDTGSEDRTVEIANERGAKVYHFKWIDDFSAARNESIKHCTGEWILYLDADERIKPTNFKNLRQMLKNAEKDLGAIVCTIESDHSSLDGSSELHRGGYPRLFRNLGYPKINFKGRVHEQISPSLVENGLGMSKSDIVIIHEGYNRPREEMEKKLKRNYKLLLQHVNEEPTNGYAWYQLGQTLGQMNLKDKAEEAIKFAVKCGNLGKSVYASAASTLSQFAGQKKNYEEALHWAEESLKIAPEQVYGKNLKAFALLYMGKKGEAKKIFEESLKILDSNKGVPQTGFDIMIDRNVILNGIKQAES